MQAKLSFPMIFIQTCQFFRSRFWQIIVISIIIGTLYSLTYDFFISNLMKNIINQQMYFRSLLISSNLSSTMSSIFQIVFMITVLNIINLSINSSAVYKLSSSEELNINSLVSKTTSSMLKLIGFNLIYLLISFFIAIFLALFCLMLHQIVTLQSIVVFMIFCMLIMIIYISTVYYFFIGYITGSTSKSFFEIFIATHRLIKYYWFPGCLILIITSVCILLFDLLLKDFSYNSYVTTPLGNIINIFLIYFFHQMAIFLNKKESLFENDDITNNKLLI